MFIQYIIITPFIYYLFIIDELMFKVHIFENRVYDIKHFIIIFLFIKININL